MRWVHALGIATLVTLGAGLVLVTGAGASGDGSAVTYRVDAAHDAVQVDSALQLPLARRWAVNFSDSVSYPLIAAGKVFVTVSAYPSSGTTLYALDQLNGHVAWSKPISGTYWWSAATYDAGQVFVVNFDGLVRAFSANDGAQLWSRSLAPQYAFSSPPTARNGVLYVGGSGSGGTLYALDESDGHLISAQPVENGDDSAPTLSDSGVFVSYACNQTYGFTLTALTPIWHDSGPCEGGGGATTVYAAGRLFTQDFFGNLTLDAATGVQLGVWGPRGDSLPAVDGDTMWALTNFTASGGTLVARDIPSGETLWSFDGDGGLYGEPLVVDGGTQRFVVALSTSGTIYGVSAGTGEVLWSAAGRPFSYASHGVPTWGLGAGQGLLVIPVDNQLAAYAFVGGARCDLSQYPVQKGGGLLLKNVDLSNCYLQGANLDGANATNANFTSANLTGASLVGANLSQATMVNAVLTNANLTNAKLTQTSLLGAKLGGAVLTGVTWSSTTCPDGTNSNKDGGTCLGHT